MVFPLWLKQAFKSQWVPIIAALPFQKTESAPVPECEFRGGVSVFSKGRWRRMTFLETRMVARAGQLASAGQLEALNAAAGEDRGVGDFPTCHDQPVEDTKALIKGELVGKGHDDGCRGARDSDVPDLG